MPSLLDRINAWFFMDSGQRRAAKGEFAKALEAYRDGLAHTPDDYGLYLHMGLCLLQASRVEDSLTALRRAADLSPENPACRLFLSMALLDGDYIKEAREAYERVIALQPDNQAAYGLKILLDLREGRASDGVADLSKKGLPANPDLAARIVMAVEAAMAEKGETLC